MDLRGAPETLFSRFGRDLEGAWRSHVAYNLNQLSTADPLIALGAYDTADLNAVRSMVAAVGRRHFDHGLAHGDLALRNLILPADGSPVLIDWGSARAGPVPYTDLMNLVRNREDQQNPTDCEIDVFVTGFGGGPDVIKEMLDLRVLHCLDVARWALDREPERIDKALADIRSAMTQRNAGTISRA